MASQNPSEEFLNYQELIVGHENYATLPNKISPEGRITWVRQGDSARAKWWDDRKNQLGLKDRASVARRIHPPELRGLKPCHVCGESLSVFAIYPNQLALSRIRAAFPSMEFEHFVDDVRGICQRIQEEQGAQGLEKLSKIFSLDFSRISSTELASKIIDLGKSLSPGVMSNAPDRLDGFHSYNACCRSTMDIGRHPANLARYSTDRRAFENWADGDWRGADRLMGLYKKESTQVKCPRCGVVAKMSPDHIGPISLGFRHQMHFQPMCSDCNSAKNNRMTFEDVKMLVASESSGTRVASWHSEAIWEALKPLIVDDSSALRVSGLMRRNLHHVLSMLSVLYKAGFKDFLSEFLHPEYAAFDFEFKNFNPSTGNFKASRFAANNENTRKQAARYLRISFESLESYSEKKNRNSKMWENPDCDVILDQVISDLAKGAKPQARRGISRFLEVLAEQAATEL